MPGGRGCALSSWARLPGLASIWGVWANTAKELFPEPISDPTHRPLQLPLPVAAGVACPILEGPAPGLGSTELQEPLLWPALAYSDPSPDLGPFP